MHRLKGGLSSTEIGPCKKVREDRCVPSVLVHAGDAQEESFIAVQLHILGDRFDISIAWRWVKADVMRMPFANVTHAKLAQRGALFRHPFRVGSAMSPRAIGLWTWAQNIVDKHHLLAFCPPAKQGSANFQFIRGIVSSELPHLDKAVLGNDHLRTQANGFHQLFVKIRRRLVLIKCEVCTAHKTVVIKHGALLRVTHVLVIERETLGANVQGGGRCAFRRPAGMKNDPEIVLGH